VSGDFEGNQREDGTHFNGLAEKGNHPEANKGNLLAPRRFWKCWSINFGVLLRSNCEPDARLGYGRTTGACTIFQKSNS